MSESMSMKEQCEKLRQAARQFSGVMAREFARACVRVMKSARAFGNAVKRKWYGDG